MVTLHWILKNPDDIEGIKKKKKKSRNCPAAKLERHDPMLRTHFRGQHRRDILNCIMSLGDGDHSVYVAHVRPGARTVRLRIQLIPQVWALWRFGLMY